MTTNDSSSSEDTALHELRAQAERLAPFEFFDDGRPNMPIIEHRSKLLKEIASYETAKLKAITAQRQLTAKERQEPKDVYEMARVIWEEIMVIRDPKERVSLMKTYLSLKGWLHELGAVAPDEKEENLTMPWLAPTIRAAQAVVPRPYRPEDDPEFLF